jgi:hypothetical protein
LQTPSGDSDEVHFGHRLCRRGAGAARPPGPEAEAKKWIDSEFQPSTLSKDQQMAEMKWFIDAAKKLRPRA